MNLIQSQIRYRGDQGDQGGDQVRRQGFRPGGAEAASVEQSGDIPGGNRAVLDALTVEA